MTPRSLLLLLLALGPACTPEPGGSTGDATGSSGATDISAGETTVVVPTSAGESGTSEATGTSETTVDPDYRRDCQAGDFVCDDWGCELSVVGGECYKRCSPDAGIGEPDAECDEPERPFCSQVGRALGGDFDCNGCAHVCVSAAFNQCQQPATACE